MSRHDLAWLLVSTSVLIFACLGAVSLIHRFRERRALAVPAYADEEPLFDQDDPTWITGVAASVDSDQRRTLLEAHEEWMAATLADFREWLARTGNIMPDFRREILQEQASADWREDLLRQETTRLLQTQ